MVLFQNWIAATKQLQETSFGHTLPKQGEELLDWVRINVLAAEDELHEALNETGWKPWATDRTVHREAFIGEIVDSLHFIGNLLAGVECTDEELNEAYTEKMERNAARQANGYTGTDKCEGCQRAVDDLKAHDVPYSIVPIYQEQVHIKNEYWCNTCLLLGKKKA